MLGNPKLTYSKVFVDSEQRLPSSVSSSDFVIKLNENLDTFSATVMYVMEGVIPQSYYSTPKGFYQYFYLVVYNTSDLSVVQNVRLDLANEVYFASQLAGATTTRLSTATNGIHADLFNSPYNSDSRRTTFICNNSNYSFKIPTDRELKETTVYDGATMADPMSINKLLGNYEVKAPTTNTWESGQMNLNPFNSVYIVCSELSNYHYSAQTGYSTAIIKKVNMMFNVGGITVSGTPPLINDYITISVYLIEV